MGQVTLFLTIAMVVQLPGGRPELWTRPIVEQSGTMAALAAPLDFEVFRTKVQPILTSPRKGNARCTACHSRGGGNAYLEPLSPGSTTYTEEQSRRNFERVQRLVVPGG